MSAIILTRQKKRSEMGISTAKKALKARKMGRLREEEREGGERRGRKRRGRKRRGKKRVVRRVRIIVIRDLNFLRTGN